MEYCFRTALLMLVLTGLLQARSIRLSDFGYSLLKSEVVCNDNVTFQSPTNYQASCLKTIREGLEYAKKHCTDTNERLHQALEALPKPNNSTQEVQSSVCECKEETFVKFVNASKSFIQSYNAS